LAFPWHGSVRSLLDWLVKTGAASVGISHSRVSLNQSHAGKPISCELKVK
jgi:hypothetical protein